MNLEFLKPVYADPGPYATVYLATSRAAEDAAKALELRWRSARAELEASGADGATLDAVETALESERVESERGRVLCAAGGQTLLDAALLRPAADAVTRWGPLPDLLDYLAERGERVPYTCAIVDRGGADLVSVTAAGTLHDAQVEYDGYPMTKVRGGDEVNKQYHRRVETEWERAAEKVAEELAREVRRAGSEVVVLAGDPRARSLLLSRLDDRIRERTVETEAGGRAAGASMDPLAADVADAVQATAQAHLATVLDEFRTQLGQEGRAVAGLAGTVRALCRGQVGTLLLTTRARDATVWIGESPLLLATDRQELADLGASAPEPERADMALIRAAMGGDADLLVPEDDAAELPEGVGAVLRYADPVTPD